MTEFLANPHVISVAWALVKSIILLGFIVVNVMFLVWLERKVSAFIQRRLGPMRVGRPHGWLQLIADMVKMIAKEDVMPRAVDRWLFVLAPIVSFTPAFMVYVVIPFGPGWVASDLNIAVLYVAAVTSFSVISFLMSGWGSNNKYSVVGAMRAAAMIISYEVPLVLAVIGVVMLAGSLSLVDIVNAQSRLPFIIYQPLGFIIFLTSALTECNRTPFDLVEAESELVAGYCTEYSGLRWGFFFMAEYANLLSASAIAATLYLGGWKGPLLPPVIWFLIKTYLFVLFAMWLRWTLPRIRIDQMMDVAWKFLLPASLVNIAITGFLMF